MDIFQEVKQKKEANKIWEKILRIHLELSLKMNIEKKEGKK